MVIFRCNEDDLLWSILSNPT